MLDGLRSQIFYVTDLSAAKAWYTSLLGADPYYDEAFYVGFNVGGYELGLLPSGDAAGGGGIRLGALTDPQGNVLGVIENPHFRIEAAQ